MQKVKQILKHAKRQEEIKKTARNCKKNIKKTKKRQTIVKCRNILQKYEGSKTKKKAYKY